MFDQHSCVVGPGPKTRHHTFLSKRLCQTRDFAGWIPMNIAQWGIPRSRTFGYCYSSLPPSWGFVKFIVFFNGTVPKFMFFGYQLSRRHSICWRCFFLFSPWVSSLFAGICFSSFFSKSNGIFVCRNAFHISTTKGRQILHGTTFENWLLLLPPFWFPAGRGGTSAAFRFARPRGNVAFTRMGVPDAESYGGARQISRIY